MRELVTKREEVIDRFLTLMNQDSDFEQSPRRDTSTSKKTFQRD